MKKVRTKFLWFPKRINGITKWLQTASYEVYIHFPSGEIFDFYKEVPIRWIENDL